VTPRADYSDGPVELRRLGATLRNMREAQGLKQIEVATAAGVSESQVSDIERGKNNPGWLLLSRLIDGCGLGVSDFASAYERSSLD
jgi:transcriptional regulator with XRE-family HTH domain